MKKRALIVASFLATGLFIFNSCDKVETTESESVTGLQVEMTEDDAMADEIYSGVESMVDAELMDLEASAFSVSTMKSTNDEPFTCKVVTVDKPDTTEFPKTITIDYGDGCSVVLNGDTITRSGIIQVVISDRPFVEGATRTITFIDFYINDIKIEGTIVITYLGKNKKGHHKMHTKLSDGKLFYCDSLMYTRNAERNREWIRHMDPRNDTMLVTGGATGTNGDSLQYQHQIQDTLRLIRCYSYGYQWTIVSGEIDIEREGEVASLNFGNGDCDSKAMLQVDGLSKEINARNRFNNKRQEFKKQGSGR